MKSAVFMVAGAGHYNKKLFIRRNGNACDVLRTIYYCCGFSNLELPLSCIIVYKLLYVTFLMTFSVRKFFQFQNVEL